MNITLEEALKDMTMPDMRIYVRLPHHEAYSEVTEEIVRLMGDHMVKSIQITSSAVYFILK